MLYREGAVIQIKRWSIFGEVRNSSFRRRPRAKRDASFGRALSVQLAERTRPMHQMQSLAERDSCAISGTITSSGFEIPRPVDIGN
jgi:hypothetical protein